MLISSAAPSISGWNLAHPNSGALKKAHLSLVGDSGSAIPADQVSLSGGREGSAQKAAGRSDSKIGSNPGYYDVKADQQAKAKFYGDTSRFDRMSPGELFDELSGLVSEKHRPLDYAPDRYLYPEVDRHKDGQLYCIYSGDAPEVPGGDSSNPLQKGEYNCEHVVPQSWFHKKSTPRGDLHHLFASVISCNSLRGNSQYDDDVNQGENMIACGIYSKEDNLFNPHAGKGETARAVLYFMLRYPGQIGDDAHEYGVSDLPMLLEWNREHPPTEYEFHRNQMIEKLQGNRNPLVDFPELADKIDFTRGVGKEAR